MSSPESRHPDRRTVLAALTALGVGTVPFQRALAGQFDFAEDVTVEMMEQAEWVAGIHLSEEQREQVRHAVARVVRKRKALRAAAVDYSTLPALRFDPELLGPATQNDLPEGALTKSRPVAAGEAGDESTHWLSIREMGAKLRNGSTTAVQLAEAALNRLKEIDPELKCVVNLTESVALEQAQRADRELAGGMDRGPLHGIPWGAKDLIAIAGFPTTWGAPQFREQVLQQTATVARKLEQAGAVLVAKLSLGALAMGDKWFGGQTRNPWNTEQGSSGSSAGSAAAVAAGAVPFALGSETLGSIVSPSRRCGVTGLRPTFGRVSRFGCMALSWSMDKIGPIARTVDDCGIVLAAIHGADKGDPTSVSRPYDWPQSADLTRLKVGRVAEGAISKADQELIDFLEQKGASVVPVELPHDLPVWEISMMLDAEAATVFHDLVESGEPEGLNSWPNTFRRAHFLSAVDYLHAARVRTTLMERMADVFQQVDLYVGGNDLGISNLTGHPCIAVPTVMSDGTHPQPQCATMTAGLYHEALLLAVAQQAESESQLTSQRPSI